MRDAANSSDGFYIAWSIVVAAIFVGAFCLVQHGDAVRLTTPAGELTSEQIEAIEREILELMDAAEWTQERRDQVMRNFNCKYRPEATEDCNDERQADDAGSRR